MAISVVSVGSLAIANATTAATPALPAGYSTGDLLVCFSWARATGSASMSPGTGWTQYVAGSSGNFKPLVSYRVATGSDSSPTITPSGMSGAQKHMHRVIAFSGVDTTSPWGGNSTWTQNASAEDIGPVPAATASAASGAVLVMGCRLELWTSVATLSGDGLTWSELVEDTDNTIGNALATVLDFAPWTGGAPTLTSKTFDATGGTNSVGAGWMLLLNAAASAYTLAADGGGLSTTGQAAGLLAGRRVDAAAGAYAKSGTDAGLLAGRRVAAASGGYGATGQDAATIAARALAGAGGSFVISGQAAGVLRGYLVQAAFGAYAATGTDATLSHGTPSGSTLTADGGSYALGGQTVELLCGRVLPGGASSYVATGAGAGFLRGSVLGSGAGSFAIAGTAASLVYGTPTRTLVADPGAYGLSGQDAGLSLWRRMTAASATFALAGEDADLLRTCVLAAFAGAYDLTGADATLRRQAAWSPGSRPMVYIPRRSGAVAVAPRDLMVVPARFTQIVRH